MTSEEAITIARAGMQGLIERASASPAEEDIARRAAMYVEELDAGDWNDQVEQVFHAMGWLDCQLVWWRTMSKRERDYVGYYRAVLKAHKLPERPTSRTFSATAAAVGKSRKWLFSTSGVGREKALAFGEAYDALPGLLKSGVKARGKSGGRRKVAA